MSTQPAVQTPADLFNVPETPRRELAIEVRGLSKAYRIPLERLDTLKERIVRPFDRREYRRLQALDSIDFDVERGEFFGIIGRNGSGKSTLLKLLGSIYRADAGLIRIAGRVVPFIELGVGFNDELNAHENIVLNGVMMGLTPREARRRTDAVIDFAELGEFSELKLKNYSSGMLVRLGFSLLTQVDADVLLIDEVLAVGDAAFQQKSFDAFSRLHREGRTIVLVTHDMSTVESHCDRAILLEGGEIEAQGDPGDVARRYMQLNFESRRADAKPEDVHFAGADNAVSFGDVQVLDADGRDASSIETGRQIQLRARIEARTQIERPLFSFQIVNADGLQIFAPHPVELEGARALEAGDRIDIEATIANPLAAGHYYVHLGVGRLRPRLEMIAFRKQAADFVVFGAQRFGGLVGIEHELKARVER
jgi:ABC-type polysaccharide/polyol phosphate transport system ATPase subunit